MATRDALEDGLLERLLRAGETAWQDFEAHAADRHHLFIPCDQRGAAKALEGLPRGLFVELGSAAGVVTIAADLLGFEAYGIEIEPWLVERSRELAARFASRASFAEGSFVPADYRDEVDLLSSDFLTPTEGADGLEELGLSFTDIDVLFCYPRPNEHDWLRQLVHRYARPDALLLTYDGCEGFEVLTAGSL